MMGEVREEREGKERCGGAERDGERDERGEKRGEWGK